MTNRESSGHLTGIRVAAILGMTVTTLVIATIAVVTTEVGGRDSRFWGHVVWSVILVGMLWLYIGGFFSVLAGRGKQIEGVGGVLPSFGISVFLYVAISFLLMGLSIYFPSLTPLSVSSNIFRASGLIIIAIFIYFSWAAGVVDTESVPRGVVPPRDLARDLRECESAVLARSDWQGADRARAESVRNSFKRLRETIEFSLPQVGRIGRSERYQDFAVAVISLSGDCKEMASSSAGTIELEGLKTRADALVSQAAAVSHDLVRT